MLDILRNNLNLFFKNLNKNAHKNVLRGAWFNSVQKMSVLPLYYIRNENIWQDGFLFDFLQKKTADAWVRRFVIYTGFLFSERLVFDSIVRLYVDNVVWVGHDNSIFEVSNVSDVLSATLYVYLTLFFILFGVFILI